MLCCRAFLTPFSPPNQLSQPVTLIHPFPCTRSVPMCYCRYRATIPNEFTWMGGFCTSRTIAIRRVSSDRGRQGQQASESVLYGRVPPSQHCSANRKRLFLNVANIRFAHRSRCARHVDCLCGPRDHPRHHRHVDLRIREVNPFL